MLARHAGGSDCLDQAGLSSGRKLEVLPGLIKRLFGFRDFGFSHVWVVQDGGQLLVRVAVLQVGELLSSLRNTGTQGNGLLAQLIDQLRCINKLLAHISELSGLLIQLIIGLATGADDLDQQRALFAFILVGVGAQPLVQAVGVCQRLPGITQSPGKLTGALLTKLGDGDLQFLFTLADGFIRGVQFLIGQLLQHVGGLSRQVRGGFWSNGTGCVQLFSFLVLPVAAGPDHSARGAADARHASCAQPCHRCGVGGSSHHVSRGLGTFGPVGLAELSHCLFAHLIGDIGGHTLARADAKLALFHVYHHHQGVCGAVLGAQLRGIFFRIAGDLVDKDEVELDVLFLDTLLQQAGDLPALGRIDHTCLIHQLGIEGHLGGGALCQSGGGTLRQ